MSGTARDVSKGGGNALAALAGLLFAMMATVSQVGAETGDRFQTLLSRVEALQQRAGNKASDCSEDACGPKQCRGEAHILADLTNVRTALDRYAETLEAEEALLEKANLEAITNNDRLSGQLEAARIAASSSRATDEMLGTATEVNGVIDNLRGMAQQSLTETLRNPAAIWETIKDLNSLLNRFDHSYNHLQHQVESITYQPDVSDAAAKDRINLKALLEDSLLIDNLPLINEAGRTAIKENSSNAVDALSARDELVKMQKELKELGAMADTWQKEGTKALSDAKAKVRANAMRNVAFAMTQIASRYVKTKISEPALTDFRAKIQKARQQFAAQGHPYLKQVAAQEEVRDQLSRLSKLDAKLKKAIDTIAPCAHSRCNSTTATRGLVDLPPLERDPRNGKVRLQEAQTDLQGKLDQMVGALEGHLETAAAELHTITDDDLIFKPQCAQCRSLALDLKANGDRLAFVGKRLAALPDTNVSELRAMKNKREALLREAEEANALYKERTEGRIGRKFGKLHADGQAELLEIARTMRRLAGEARTLRHKIRRIEAINNENTALIRAQTAGKQAQKALLERFYACNDRVCRGQEKPTQAELMPNNGAQQGSESVADRRDPDCDEEAPGRPGSKGVMTKVTTTPLGATPSVSTSVTTTPLSVSEPSSNPALVGKITPSAPPVKQEKGDAVLLSFPGIFENVYFCNKPGNGGKLSRCVDEIETNDECWVPRWIAAKGVKSCKEAIALEKKGRDQ
ncbi:hypothetical protein [Cohaesibacter intestini]|uniref:hypothetical protein n=1 Tax=Cohaesibacter intestini TaxID=2211145 RepID=UPI001300BA96|nr:hypothetical protein [Cohaesibacter intestini]